jgi:hypothetical protein
MTKKKETIKDADMEKVGEALKRAGIKAREIASQSGTPLVIYKNGQIVKQMLPKDLVIEK